jgi:uracil-DNA glycosylase
METLFTRGLTLLIGMLRNLENHPDFRVDTSTIKRITGLADSVRLAATTEGTDLSRASEIDEPVPRDALSGIPVQAPTGGSSGDATQLFDELRTKVLACTKCPNLVTFRHSVVFGVGNQRAELMFVGEAPGADEDRQGEPFVGRAGELLTKIIQTMGFQRSEVYIANVLKCRPDLPPGTPGNRQPTPAEMATCLPYLREQIELIRPKVMVALGGTAMRGLFGKEEPMKQMRGRWHLFGSIPVMATFHPSYLLRNQALFLKRQVWEDMLLVLERLDRSISEKQRNYFLPR